MSRRWTNAGLLPIREGGFTLIETLVALAIMAIAMGAFYSSMTLSYRAANQVKLHQVALAMARSHLDSIKRESSIEPGSSSGTYVNGLQWRLKIEALAPDSSRPSTSAQPYRVFLEAFDPHGGSLVRLETVKLAVGPSL